MMTVCAECGKRIVVTWPEFYVYKRGKGEDTCYFCSENCMIVSDVRDTKERSGWNDEPWITEGELEDIQAGRKPFRMLRRPTSRNSRPPAEKDRPEKPAERTGQDMGNNKSSHKLTREENEKAVELAIAGKDPIGYLKECGAKNPWASWAYIKQTLKKAKPEKYAMLPGDDDRLGEEVSFGAQAAPVKEQALPEKFEGGLTAQVADEVAEWTASPAAGNQTAAAGGDPSTPLRSAQDDKLVINAEDLAAAEDPAVKRMEAFATMEQKLEDPRDGVKRIVDDLFRFPGSVSSVENPAGRVVVDKDGVHLEPPKEPKKPDWEKTTFFGIPCEVTGMKVEEFEFRRTGNDLMMDYPGPGLLWMDKSLATVKLTVEQWKRVIELVPKVMKIFGMD